MGHSHKRKYPISSECSAKILEDLRVLAVDLSSSKSEKARYLSGEILRKYADPSTHLAKLRQQAAIEKWLGVETCNMETNIRLMCHLDDDLVIDGTPVDVLLARAAKLVQSVIGNAPPLEHLQGSFSGGASTSLRRQPGMVERKYSGKVNVSQKAWDHAWPQIYRSKVWVSLNDQVLEPEFCEHSVLFTVPKTDTIDRVACKEPDYNMWLQKACGDFIRRRLRSRAGIDLNDQSVNRGLAKTAVAQGLATVDLSSASDSVTTQLICRLLPIDWFVYLDAIRVHKVLLPDGTMHSPQMFSSMGNGFTFELESLIFWALCRSLVGREDTVSVYGDDIILPNDHFEDLVELFTYCGFTINESKSFATGLFRESCGGHYHDGMDITPIYVKGPIRCVSQLINLLNSIRRWSRLDEHSSWCDDFFAPFWRRYAPLVPQYLWGGRDLFSTETLASPTGKAMRLVRCKRTLDHDWIERGGYLQWLSVRSDSCSTPGLQRPPTVSQQEFVDWCTRADSASRPHLVVKELSTFTVKRKVSALQVSMWELPLYPFEIEQY